MKLISWILVKKATKNSLIPLPKINTVQIPMERISVCFLLCIITHQINARYLSWSSEATTIIHKKKAV